MVSVTYENICFQKLIFEVRWTCWNNSRHNTFSLIVGDFLKKVRYLIYINPNWSHSNFPKISSGSNELPKMNFLYAIFGLAAIYVCFSSALLNLLLSMLSPISMLSLFSMLSLVRMLFSGRFKICNLFCKFFLLLL
jgi:hypothetical protein